MVRWMYGMKLQDRVPNKGLRKRLGLDDIISVQHRLQCSGHVLQKEDNAWVKKCIEYEVEGARPRCRPKKTWKKIMENPGIVSVHSICLTVFFRYLFPSFL